MSTLPRFDYLASNSYEALEYYRNRITQLISSGWSWSGLYNDLGWGIHVPLVCDGVEYDSVYVLDRGKGHLKRWLTSAERNFVTISSCERMYEWLKQAGISFACIETPHLFDSAYQEVEAFYGNKRAKRSNTFYMNHIDEGLYILNRIGASHSAKQAFCLHPIVQDDEALAGSLHQLLNPNISREAALLALEYRNIANAYLSKRMINSIEEIRLSPLEDVNHMLIADKIQNRKDFETYHLGIAHNSDSLDGYFQNWFAALNISNDFYSKIKSEINTKAGRLNGSR